MTQYVLVTHFFNYSDEFDVEGFIVTSEEQHDMWLAEAKAILDAYEERGEPWQGWFGTNQAIQVRSYSDYLDGLTITRITEEEAATIVKVLGDSRIFGHIFYPD